MKKTYLYKLCTTNRIYADRDSAVQAAFENIKEANFYRAGSAKMISSPVVTKVDGGYLVVCFNEKGKPLSRKLDVFVAEKKKRVVSYKTVMARHKVHERSTNQFNEDDDFCDFDCEDCVRSSTCEDYFSDDEYEDED